MEGGALHDYSSKVDRHHLRDWSLITGRGGGLRNGRGACEVLPLQKGGGADFFSHAEGGTQDVFG